MGHDTQKTKLIINQFSKKLLLKPTRTIGFIFILLFLITISNAAAQSINPSLKIKSSGAITDLFIDGTISIISTDAGTIESYNLISGKQTASIQLPEMKSFMGDEVPTKVYSIDKISQKLIAVTQGLHGFRNVMLFEGGKTTQLMDAEKDKLMVKKVRFITERLVLFGLLSNELILFDIDTKEVIYEMKIAAYSFSDFCLTTDHQFVYTADESGVVHKINVNEGVVEKEYSGNNVDNIYQLVFKEGIIVTAGQDRRVGVYNTTLGTKYYLQKDFLVYAVGINTDAPIGAYCASEENEITLFDIETKTETGKLIGHESVVTKIEFIDNQTLVTAGDDGYLIVWKIN